MKYQHSPGGTEEAHGKLSVMKIYYWHYICTWHPQNTDGRTGVVDHLTVNVGHGDLFVCFQRLQKYFC
jgi:hypothetical protein